jgi:glycerol uptake facilitator-like aquaporin
MIGGYVVAGLLGLILTILLLIALYAAFTKPEIQEAKDLAPQNVATTYNEQRTAWFTEIKDLIQILVVSLFVPLLGTVVGYLFGRQQAASPD